MADLTLIKKDDVYLKVQCEPSISQELQQHFCFDAPNARFHPLYKSKVWDGKIRLYSMFTKEIYLGLKDYVKHFAENNNYTIDEANLPPPGDDVTHDEIVEFCESLNLNLPNGSEIHTYQIEAIHKAITEGRKLLLSPTGSGKSLIIYCILRWHLSKGRNQLIVVPTTSLVEQLYSDFQSYSQNNDWRVSYHTQRIYSGHEKEIKMPIVISTWQSIYQNKKPFFSKFNVIYGDECHQFTAKSLTSIMEKCVSVQYRIGTTGTLNETKTHKLVLEGLFGSVYRTTTTRKLMDDLKLSDLKIKCIVLKYPDDICKTNTKFNYNEERDFIVAYQPRNKFVRNLSLAQKGNTLVLYQLVEKHGKVLYDSIASKVEGRKVFFVHGGTETVDREEVRRIVEQENDAIIVASYGTFSTGINIRNLHNVIFASPYKSKIKVLQSIGRGLRLGDNKTKCKLYDIGDDMSWKSKKNYTLQHMVERIKLYADEQFDYSFIKVDL